MNRPEQVLHRAVMQYLHVALARDAIAWHTPNGGARSAREAAILAGLGVLAGMPDVVILHLGKLHAIELKSDRGRLSERQADVLARLEGAGCTVAVARTLDEVIATLTRWGLTRTGAKVAA